MKLEEQSYQVLDRWKIEIVSHGELLWVNKQIIRMREAFFKKTQVILDLKKELNLYNHYNPINTDLIRKYREDKQENMWAMIANIISSNNIWPILDWENMIQVNVEEMQNIFFEDINSRDIEKSLAYNWDDIWVLDLINWLSKDFYSWRLKDEDITKYQRLFYRKIKLPNN